MNEIERAIELISEGEIDYSGIYDCELNERVTEVILNALREKVEREIGCIEDCPTIDAVPVVRCRECMYRQKAKVNRKGFLICPASGMEITDDDYCSYGAKMEDKP